MVEGKLLMTAEELEKRPQDDMRYELVKVEYKCHRWEKSMEISH